MSTGVIIVTGIAFAIGMVIPWIHARRRARARMADVVTRVVEKKLAEAAVARAAQGKSGKTAQRDTAQSSSENAGPH